MLELKDMGHYAGIPNLFKVDLAKMRLSAQEKEVKLA